MQLQPKFESRSVSADSFMIDWFSAIPKAKVESKNDFRNGVQDVLWCSVGEYLGSPT